MAQAGKRVVLVDADLERPDLHRLFGVESARGLTDLIGRESGGGGPSAAELVREVPAVPNLYLVLGGPQRPAQTQSLGVERASGLVEQLANMADIVIFDGASASLNADSLALASQLDGVLVVARARTTRRDTVRELVDCLALVHAHVIGGVLNGALDHSGVSTGNHRRSPTASTAGPWASA
jgi:Mrp family chromosome partitioning ATPase